MKLLCILISFCIFTGCAAIDRSNPRPMRKEVKNSNQVSNKDDSTPKKRVLILPFLDASDNHPQSLKVKSRAAFITSLNRSGELFAVDSNQLSIDPMKSLDVKNKEFKLPELAKAANALGVNVVLEGKILDIRIKRKTGTVGIVRNMQSTFEIVLRVRMMNLRTGKEIFNTVKTVTLEQEDVRVAERVDTDRFIEDNPEMIEVMVKDAFLDFSPQIVGALDKVSWEGRIAAINGDRIYLNVGKISGIQVGDLLKVSEDGEDIYDSESGNHIGKVPGRLKGTLEVISYFGNDGSIAIIHSGSGFRENDRVEIY